MAAKNNTNGDVLRVVLVGKTGNGKSTLGNALTGLKGQKFSLDKQRHETTPERRTDPNTGFTVGRGLSSTTTFCNWKRGERMGTVMEVTDTPGLCDTHMKEKGIYKELAKSVAVAEPGAHVIIFVLRCDKPFTEEELEAYKTIQRLFSEELSKYLIIVFNGIDIYNDENDSYSVERQRDHLKRDIETRGEPLKTMIEEADGRVFGMNNGPVSHPTSPSKIDSQIQDLITMMKDLVKGNGLHPYYRTEMTDQIMQVIEEIIHEKAKKEKDLDTRGGQQSHDQTTMTEVDLLDDEENLDTRGGQQSHDQTPMTEVDLLDDEEDLDTRGGQQSHDQTPMTEVDLLDDEEVHEFHVNLEMKQAIISEEVGQGIFNRFIEVVVRFTHGIKNGVKSLCSVM